MQSTTFVGGDVSTETISFAMYGDTQPVQAVSTQKQALMAYLQQLPPQTWLAVEATNTYHRLVVALAYQAHRRVLVLNPNDVSHYRQGVGYRAKTDRVDAQLRARYLAKEQAELKPWQPPTPAQEALETLIARRATVTQARQALRQSWRDVETLRAAAPALDRQFVATLKPIDQPLAALIQQDFQRRQSVKHRHTVPGVGPLGSTALATVLPRIPFAKADAAVAFSGLDPRPRDSGQCRGQRKLSKRGPAELRRLLSIAAMTAARHPVIKAFHDRQRAKGLSPIAAYNVLARKLLRTAWSIVRYNRPFDLQRFAGALT